MSGRSGYGRSRIVGKLIHLPANMNMAGLAPRVGKPGWAIRLYYQRVDGCCFCPEPIRITRRIFVTGNSINNATLTAGNGLVTDINATLPGNNPASSAQAYYGIIFNKKLQWTGPTIPPGSTETIVLVQVTESNANTAGTTVATLTNDDFLKINDTSIGSQQWGPVGQTFNINLGDKTTSGSAAWTTVNQSTGAGVNNTRLFGSGGGSSAMAYIVTNPNKIGGYGVLFNITQILNSSRAGANNNNSGISITNASDQTQFRSNLFAMTTGGNNISTTYTPGTLVTPDDCFGNELRVSAPVNGFAIADTTGQPPLELLA